MGKLEALVKWGATNPYDLIDHGFSAGYDAALADVIQLLTQDKYRTMEIILQEIHRLDDEEPPSGN